MNELTSALSVDLTDTSIKRPLVSPTVTQVRIVSCQEESSKTPGRMLLTTVVETTVPVDGLDEKGKTVTVQPGFALTDRILLTPTEKFPIERVKQELKKLMTSVGKDEGPFGQPSEYIGKLAAVRIVIESDSSGEYDDQNRIKWIPANRVTQQAESL